MTRPFILDPLFRSVTVLPGIGPRNAKFLEKLTGSQKIFDLLCHFPVDVIDRTNTPALSDAVPGSVVTLKLEVMAHHPNKGRSHPYRISCRDHSGRIDLIYFHAGKAWLEKQFPVGAHLAVCGKIESYRQRLQMVHPDEIVSLKEISKIARLTPLYPLTSGLSHKALYRAVTSALRDIPVLPEWLDITFKTRESLPDWHRAFQMVHVPHNEAALSPDHPARRRLAYDELLSNQLTIGLMRLRRERQTGRSLPPAVELRQKVLNSLPFELTPDQYHSLQEIDRDMEAPNRMMRLLQGDVGCGKTLVCTLAILNAAAANAQAALMAPTEILARQHGETLLPLLAKAGLRGIVLTGRDKGRNREKILDDIKTGKISVVIGTHALFQKDVHFKDLALAVIDEQHRFGVHQRMELASKGYAADTLIMTATPIPRTLCLTAYGDMDVSRIEHKPPGRSPIETRIMSNDRIAEIAQRLHTMIAKGNRVYWVCPLVEESETLELSAVQERYESLQHLFPGRIGLIHGRMKAVDKSCVMNAFASGQKDILVATTVIEVGVNVPEATIMVIEHAERFGLAQLHQLRGRVGRGDRKSYCFLVHGGKPSETGKERLRVMRETEDGFLIAEKDLKLRGGGEILGTKQSGLPECRIADLAAHADLLDIATSDSRLILDKDPQLQGERGQALRILLYLFERERATRYLKTG